MGVPQAPATSSGSIKITPAASRARRHLCSVDSRGSVPPFSNCLVVIAGTPDFSAWGLNDANQAMPTALSRVTGAGPLRLAPVATAFSIAQSPESSFRLGDPKVRRSRVPPLGLSRIGPQTLDVPARKLVGVVCFGEFESGSGKPTLGSAKEVLPGNEDVALVEVAVPSLDQPFELC